MSLILGIDPGPVESAWVILDTEARKIVRYGETGNLVLIAGEDEAVIEQEIDYAAIEMVSSMGMPVGKEVFETVFWIGRIVQAVGDRMCVRIPRNEIKMALCNSMRAKDSNIRQALIDIYGAPGTKKNPGPTYGLSGDMWQALAVAHVAMMKIKEGK